MKLKIKSTSTDVTVKIIKMKQTQLRNIIKELIISEQTSQYKYVTIHPCNFYQGGSANVQCGGNYYGTHYGAGRNIKIDGATPQPGDTFYFPGWLAKYNADPTRFTDACTGCPAQVWKVKMVQPRRPYRPDVDWNSAQCGTFPNQGTSYGPCTPGGGCPTCDPSAWGNLTNWTNTWTNNNAFNSTSSTQPCNHICQKITQWTNACTNAGPVQQNQLACKIAEGNNQASIHGCNC